MKVKKECEIVQDLLFSYNDGVLSNSSKELVEEHLKDCSECNEKLKEIKLDNKKENKKQEVDYLKKVNGKLKRRKRLMIISIILVAIIIIFNIAVFVNYSFMPKTMEIFLEDNISQEQKQNIESAIKSKYPDLNIKYNSSEDSLNKMKENLGDQAYMLNGYEGENNIFPQSYFIDSDEDTIKDIVSIVENMDGVKKISTQIEVNPYEYFVGSILF